MSSKKAARKNGKSSTEQELRAKLSTLQAQLTTSEKRLTKTADRAERWKTEAKTHKKAASRVEARVNKLERKLERATDDVAVEAVPVARPDASSLSPDDAAATVNNKVPDQTWSVVQLRAEARRRGMVGLSNKPKTDLIAALS